MLLWRAGLLLAAGVALAAGAAGTGPYPAPGTRAAVSPDVLTRLMAEPGAPKAVLLGTLPVTPGRAYVLRAPLDGRLRYASARLELRFVDAEGRSLATQASAPAFGNFSRQTLDTTALASPRSRRAQAWAVLHTDGLGATGGVRVGPAELRAGVLLSATTATPVIEAGGRPSIRLRWQGLPPGAAARLTWRLTDFDGRLMVRGEVQPGGSGGGGEHTFSLPALPAGYYELRADGEASDPVLTLGLARGRASLSLVVVAGPAPVPRPPAIGLDAGLSWAPAARRPELARLAALSGVAVLRDRLSWAATEPAAGRFEWAPYRDTARLARRAGLAVGTVFHDTPAWASDRNDPAAPPRDADAAYRYGQALGRALGPELAFLEVGNEPDGAFFSGPPEAYSALLKATRLGVGSTRPGLTVLLAAVSGTGPFLDRALADNAGAYADAANLHHYGEPEALLEHALPALRRALDGHGLAHLPIWVTETGLPFAPSAASVLALDPATAPLEPTTPAATGDTFGREATRVSAGERAQVSYLVRAYAAALAGGAERVFYFYLPALLHRHDTLWGLLREDGSPRPAYAALATLTRQLGPARPTAWERRSGAYAVYFEGAGSGGPGAGASFEPPDSSRAGSELAGGDLTAVVWGGGRYPVRAAGPVTDAVGRVVEATGPPRPLDLTLSELPLYVHGLERAALDRPAVRRVHAPPRPRALPRPSPVWVELLPPPGAGTAATPSNAKPASNGPATSDPAISDPAGDKLAARPVSTTSPFALTARVRNTSAAALTATLTCTPTAGFTVAGEAVTRLRVPAGGSADHVFRLSVSRSAARGPVTGAVRVSLTTDRGADHAHAHLRVAPETVAGLARRPLLRGQSLEARASANARAELSDPVATPGVRLTTHVYAASETWAALRLPLSGAATGRQATSASRGAEAAVSGTTKPRSGLTRPAAPKPRTAQARTAVLDRPSDPARPGGPDDRHAPGLSKAESPDEQAGAQALPGARRRLQEKQDFSVERDFRAGPGLQGADALELRLRRPPAAGNPPALVVQLEEAGGALWVLTGTAAPGRQVLALADAKPAPWAPDPDGRLDAARVRAVWVGWGAHAGRPGETLSLGLDSLEALDW